MKGIYQHCSEKHLHRYVAEFDFRYNERSALGVNDSERTKKVFSGIIEKRFDVQGLVSAGRLIRNGVMRRKITLSIRARGPTDSPTVDDLLDQLRDYFDILEGVEEAIAEDGSRAIEWRIVKATTNTPITFEAGAFPKDFGVNIDNRAEIVTQQTALGLSALQYGGERPPYFTDTVLLLAEKMFGRVTNGLDLTSLGMPRSRGAALSAVGGAAALADTHLFDATSGLDEHKAAGIRVSSACLRSLLPGRWV